MRRKKADMPMLTHQENKDLKHTQPLKNIIKSLFKTTCSFLVILTQTGQFWCKVSKLWARTSIIEWFSLIAWTVGTNELYLLLSEKHQTLPKKPTFPGSASTVGVGKQPWQNKYISTASRNVLTVISPITHSSRSWLSKIHMARQHSSK